MCVSLRELCTELTFDMQCISEELAPKAGCFAADSVSQEVFDVLVCIGIDVVKMSLWLTDQREYDAV